MQVTVSTPTVHHKNMILPSHIRVLHIISGDLWAGAETQALTLITTIEDCDITVALMNHGELETRLIKAGINTIVINERSLSSLKITHQLIQLIKRLKPDIIHTHRQKENILGSFANFIAHKGISRQAKSVRTTHGAPEYKTTGLKKIINWLDNFCGKHLQDAVISVSSNLKEQLKHTFPENLIHIIPNGADLDELQKTTPAPDIRANMDDYYHVGIVGRLEPVKRIDLFIHAAQQIVQRQPTLKIIFHIVGDGKLKQELITLTQELGMSSHIQFHGHRSDSTRVIASLDVIVMCSDHEGTPMTALETLALGKPLVAHAVGGLREILIEYPQLLVDNHSADGYSSKIIELINNPIIPSLNNDYSSSSNAASTRNLYQQLLKGVE